MKNKKRYYEALKQNKGQLNEIDLGESIGLEEDQIRSIIIQLLAEHKIAYAENETCNYILMKKQKKGQS